MLFPSLKSKPASLIGLYNFTRLAKITGLTMYSTTKTGYVKAISSNELHDLIWSHQRSDFNQTARKKMPVRVVESNMPAQVSGTDSGNRSPLPPSSLLGAGQAFSGTQNVSNQQKEEAWRVNVQIQGIDLEHGYLCGTMEALNVPMADTPVITFWEGEIVDGKNYTFYTGKWEATRADDMRHWSKFQSFSPLQVQVESDGGRQLDLNNYPHIFMRWKEQYFVNVGTDCGLTIAGFYYVCFSCSDGSISGFYYDPNSSPFQKLELKTVNEGRSGFSFSSYELQ